MWTAVFAASNLAIFAGYLAIAFLIIPHIDVRLWLTRIGGFLFFLTCGGTHIELAVHAYVTGGLSLPEMLSGHMLAIHIVQAFAVFAFVAGLYAEFVVPQIKPRRWGS